MYRIPGLDDIIEANTKEEAMEQMKKIAAKHPGLEFSVERVKEELTSNFIFLCTLAAGVFAINFVIKTILLFVK